MSDQILSYPLDDERSSVSNVFASLRKSIEEQEDQHLLPKASRSRDHSRKEGAEIDHRLPYKRDVDRIVHSKAYSRYVDKTQVVYLMDNDHITQRGLHVQLVSNFARGVAEILRLNLDLVEAISLGHDVGHPPFGHEGEEYLSAISKKHGNGPFCHPHQSCRLFQRVEPLNLGLNVYDGFLCHDGGMADTVYQPVYGKTWEQHLEEMDLKKQKPHQNIMPATLEGCLVKISDTISYTGRDIEDAISLGIIKRDDVPETYLGRTNRDILAALATDIIENSYEKDYIALSDKAYSALKELRKFNFKHIYNYPSLKVESKKIENAYELLFNYLLSDYKENGQESELYQQFLESKTDQYRDENDPVQFVIDYIAGMTDRFFVRAFERLLVPGKIQIERV